MPRRVVIAAVAALALVTLIISYEASLPSGYAGTCDPGLEPVMTTVTLENGRRYWVAPPAFPDPTQGIDSAASLADAIRDQNPGVPMQVYVATEFAYDPSGTLMGGKCYPASGSTIFDGLSYLKCWSFTNDLDWKIREGIWVRVDAGPNGPASVTFDWHGCEPADPGYQFTLGTNLIALPYPDVPAPLADAHDLLELGPPFIRVGRFLPVVDAIQVYSGSPPDPPAWPLQVGEGYEAISPVGTGPNANSVSGVIYRDAGPQNGHFDAGERLHPQRWVTIIDPTDGVEVGPAQTNGSGGYQASTPPNVPVIVAPAARANETYTPLNYEVTMAAGDVLTGRDFGRSPMSELPVEAYATYGPPNAAGRAPRSPCPFPTGTIVLCARYVNTGDFVFNDAQLRMHLNLGVGYAAPPFVPLSSTCTHAPSSLNVPLVNQELTWNLAGIAPDEQCTVCVNLQVIAVLNTLLPMSAATYFSQAQFDSATIQPKVTCSYDPNDMQVTPQGCGVQHNVLRGQTLEYVVHFQNDGNAAADDVVVRSLLHGDLDETTLEVIDTSHLLTDWGVDSKRILAFTFNGIELPCSGVNAGCVPPDLPGSQGYVRYRISPKPGLAAGKQVTNLANIFFDSNPAVQTNSVLNTMAVDSDGDGILDPCEPCQFSPTGCRPGVDDDFGVVTPEDFSHMQPTLERPFDEGVVTVVDCNQNGVGDETDITARTSLDLNRNAVPDECENVPRRLDRPRDTRKTTRRSPRRASRPARGRRSRTSRPRAGQGTRRRRRGRQVHPR